MADKSIFETLNSIDVNDHKEAKNGFNYLSWAYAWAEVKKKYPLATYTIYENPQGWNYFTDGRTCWVKTGLTIDGLEHIEYLPVLDYKNNSIKAEDVTSYDVNKAIQRSLTKAAARHGLGLYIYAGEDLPENPVYEYKCSQCGQMFNNKVYAEATLEKYKRYICKDCCDKAAAKAKAKKQAQAAEPAPAAPVAPAPAPAPVAPAEDTPAAEADLPFPI